MNILLIASCTASSLLLAGLLIQLFAACAYGEQDPMIPEETFRFAESVLERCGAVPTDLNERNREALGQRVTYRRGDQYFRIDRAAFDGRAFLILSCAEDERFAAVGLMEDVEAVDPGLPEQEIERILRAAVESDAKRPGSNDGPAGC